MIRKIVTIGATISFLAASALPVLAAKPATQACFGKDISGYARNGETNTASFFDFRPGVGWGTFISGVARVPGFDGNLGVGGEINAHQAGAIPDGVIFNSCN